MSLAKGTTLGPYEVLAPLGAGGMGEVYRARDTRLGREVAVKVLPAGFASDPLRMRRFEQEARAAGMLNHPNILAVYDTGLHEGSPYLVTELLEGQTLRQRLDQSEITQRKALEYALQIAHGLAAAHEKGITHRDLKPENLFVTRDAIVKILDFGLAKLAPEGISEGETMNAGTVPGTVMGTVNYMSPEQVRAAATDHRSDIFSFGVVLYEMLSGSRPFHGETAAETMALIVRKDPPPLQGLGALDLLVRRCLEKEPAERFQSAKDLGFALQAQFGSEVATPPAPSQVRRFSTLGWAAAVVASLAAGYFLHRTPSPVQPVFHQITYRKGTVYSARFAPDGHTVVYSARWNGQPIETYAVSRDYPESRALGLASNLLSVSPTGDLAVLKDAQYRVHYQWVGTLASAPLGGGAPRDLMEHVREADHAPDGGLAVVIQDKEGEKSRLEFPVGKILYETTGWLSHPRISPKADRVAFLEHPIYGDDLGSVVMVDLSGKKTILSAGWGAVEGLAWNPAGDEVWFSAATTGELYAVRAVKLNGKVRNVLTGSNAQMILDIARDGRLLVANQNYRGEVHAVVAGDSADHDLSWLDSSILTRLSRDGKSILFSEQSETTGELYSLCFRKTDGSAIVRLGQGIPIAFSPDGKSVLSLVPSSPPQLVVFPVGPGSARPVERGVMEASMLGAWFPDGKRILLIGNEPGQPSHFYTQSLAGGVPKLALPDDLLPTDAPIMPPISRDGNSIPCFRSDRKWWLCSLNGGPHQPLVGLLEDENPLSWSEDGRSLFTASIRRVPVRFNKVDVPSGRRQLWKEWPPAGSVGLDWLVNIDITPDGKTMALSLIRQLSDLFIVEGVK